MSIRPTRAWQTQQHPLQFKSACQQIETAVHNAFPSGPRPGYNKVAVLLFHWDNDDIGVDGLERKLGDIFHHSFRFLVEYFVIPSFPPGSTPDLQLQDRLIQFRNVHQGDKNLLIYVYSGHAWAGPSTFGLLLFGATNPPVQPRDIDWLGVRFICDSGMGQTLYIFDCCYAATTTIDHRNSEILAAAAIENTAGASLTNCLTNRFIGLLNRYKDQPMSIASYHSYLLSEMNQPGFSLDSTPVIITRYNAPSTILEPVMPANQISVLEAARRLNPPTARVLVSITLEGRASIPSVLDFEKYLITNIPSGIADIKVEAAFQSNSQILLVSLPSVVWATLSEDKSIHFIAHVKSPNILAGSGPGLSIRPKGSENILLSDQASSSK